MHLVASTPFFCCVTLLQHLFASPPRVLHLRVVLFWLVVNTARRLPIAVRPCCYYCRGLVPLSFWFPSFSPHPSTSLAHCWVLSHPSSACKTASSSCPRRLGGGYDVFFGVTGGRKCRGGSVGDRRHFRQGRDGDRHLGAAEAAGGAQRVHGVGPGAWVGGTVHGGAGGLHALVGMGLGL